MEKKATVKDLIEESNQILLPFGLTAEEFFVDKYLNLFKMYPSPQRLAWYIYVASEGTISWEKFMDLIDKKK